MNIPEHISENLETIFWVKNALDPGWVKKQDPDPGSGMNIPEHISENLETIFWVKNA
jgi:hypothetical protein